jgi:2-acylglycerol O-acyltransferase 2
MSNASPKTAKVAKASKAAKQAEKDQSSPTNIEQKEQVMALRRILEDCSEMRTTQDTCPPTHREVESLRQAFKNVMKGTLPTQWSNQAVQCDNVLWQLEKLVEADPDAHTGDEDRELKGGENWKFAKIPRRRRLQTLVVSLTSFFTGMPFFLGMGIFLTVWSYYTMPFMILYYVWIFGVGVRHPIKKKSWFVKSMWFKLFRDYFPVRLVIPKSVRKVITPNRNYMFCYHPHGVASFGCVPCFATEGCNVAEMLPGINIHVQTLKLNFYIPFWRELVVFAGMGDASAGTIRKTLSGPPGQSVLLVVGGAEEALLAAPKTNRILLGKRKGFVKIALEKGSPLVPIYAFGETNVYGNYAEGRPWLQNILKKMQKRLGFAIPLIKGRGWFNYNFGPIPHRRQIICVVGKPLDVPKIEKPTQEDVDEWHGKYVQALLDLYHANKPVYDVFTSEHASIH